MVDIETMLLQKYRILNITLVAVRISSRALFLHSFFILIHFPKLSLVQILLIGYAILLLGIFWWFEQKLIIRRAKIIERDIMILSKNPHMEDIYIKSNYFITKKSILLDRILRIEPLLWPTLLFVFLLYSQGLIK